MGIAKENFDKKKDAEIRVYETAAAIIAQLENLPKAVQRKIMKLVDDQLKITPPPPRPLPDYFPYNH